MHLYIADFISQANRLTFQKFIAAWDLDETMLLPLERGTSLPVAFQDTVSFTWPFVST